MSKSPMMTTWLKSVVMTAAAQRREGGLLTINNEIFFILSAQHTDIQMNQNHHMKHVCFVVAMLIIMDMCYHHVAQMQIT